MELSATATRISAVAVVAAIASSIEDSTLEFRSSLAHMVSEKSSQPKGSEENFSSSSLLVQDMSSLLIIDLVLHSWDSDGVRPQWTAPDKELGSKRPNMFKCFTHFSGRPNG